MQSSLAPALLAANAAALAQSSTAGLTLVHQLFPELLPEVRVQRVGQGADAHLACRGEGPPHLLPSIIGRICGTKHVKMLNKIHGA